MFQTILVPIDLSYIENGKAIMEVAKTQGDKEARITLINVIGEVPSFITAGLPSGILDKTVQNARITLEDMAETAGMTADVAVVSGSIAPSILAKAEEIGADLIIIASHRPGLYNYLLGSTASRIVRHAKCSVLVKR
ncbi:MAG: universal stress protein [Rhodospirillaceae bacterium]|jgi:universal stress protein F|nr:universal stress protein [Rhodospirillaceae bacterium]MBT5243379.1 universal stress protein [Rhodospirillaceae bacterium]MBT5561284.1 universal stress protein [Rhodospirillaceae bacterium]MBT6243359.1 universal stress protein [Rhodospirillaceae bacterium]MBT7139021.1 universal stress protein [Rhodospirillaceae bacterium]